MLPEGALSPSNCRVSRLIDPAWVDDRMGGIKDRFPRLGKNDRDELWMQSEPGLPRIILDVYPRPVQHRSGGAAIPLRRSSIHLS
jgi:hypothetical protein